MARPSTVARVHAAVLDLATERGPTALTMERIAARAGVGKQTLYRSWQSVPAILFDALLEHSNSSEAAEVMDVDPLTCAENLLRAADEEIATEPHASLLRALAASIQTDEALARDYRRRLLEPQLAQVHAVLRAGGSLDPERTAELLIAPVFYRWFMRLPRMSEAERALHVRQVFAATDHDS